MFVPTVLNCDLHLRVYLRTVYSILHVIQCCRSGFVSPGPDLDPSFLHNPDLDLDQGFYF